MKVNLVVVEVGVRLDKTHEEYDKYVIGSLESGGFFDEDVSVYVEDHKMKAIQYAIDYVGRGVPNTYALVYHGGQVDLDVDDLVLLVTHGEIGDIPPITDKEDVIYYFQKGWS